MQSSSANSSANLLLCVALLALGYEAWWLVRTVQFALDPWTIVLCVAALLAAALVTALFVRFPGKLEVAFILAGFLVGNFVVNYAFVSFTGRSVASIIDAKIVRAFGPMRQNEAEAAVKAAAPRADDFVSSQPVTTSNANILAQALQDAGFAEVNSIRPAHPLLPLIGLGKLPPFLPMSSASNALSRVPNSVTFGCNEGDQREFPIWRTDRYGYNNDDTVYAYPNRIQIVGDSYAQGSCVHQEETTAGVLRRNGYPAYSTGVGGFGPIFALATIKEYGERQRPKAVVWLHFDGNDISDLSEKELRSAFLLQYLTDGFSQNLMDRQGEIDTFWKSGAWGTPLQEFENSPALKAEWEKKLDENLPLVRRLLGDDISSLRDDESLVRIFTRVLALASLRVSAWGGKLYLVLVPNMDDYRSGGVSRYRFPVLNELRRLSIPVIDVDQAVRAVGDPLQFFPVRDDWGHFNAKGYRLMSRQIMVRLDQDFPPAAEKPARQAPPPAPVATPAAAAPAQPAARGHGRLHYNNFGVTSAVIPVNTAAVTPESGSSVLGLTVVRNRLNSRFLGHVVINGLATTDNEFVVAVFRSGATAPVAVIKRPLRAGQRTTIDETFEVNPGTTDAISLDVRVGLATPGGELYINGDHKGRDTSIPMPFIEVRESE
jgi:hypothetical protein